MRTHGHWNGWLRYFLDGIAWSATRAARQAGELIDLREDMRRAVADAAKALVLVDELFVNPHINAARVKQLLGVSDPTARNALVELQRAGLIVEHTGSQWGKQYLARGVLRAIEMPAGEAHD